MAPSFVKAAIFSFFVRGLTSTPPSVNAQLQKRGLIVATHATLPGNWKSLGCYLDGASTGRTLQGASYTSNTVMTEESCVSFCDSNGLNYAGVEYGQECYCGNVLSTNTPEPITDCNMACTGNSTEACGGSNRLNLFWSGKTPPPGPVTNPGPSGWTLLGCYTEGNGGRLLTTGMDVTGGSSQMTVAACTNACKQANYVYAGVEYAQECYCGNVLSNGGTLAPEGLSGCNMVCTGNSSEFCGAGNRLDVYETSSSVSTRSTSTTSSKKSSTASTKTSTSIKSSTTSSKTSASSTGSATGLPAGWKYDGCYIDGANGRILRYGQPDSQTNTVESCVKTCAGLGYTVAGMEYSTQCFCDDYIFNGGVATADTDCNMACSGNPAEKCGAGNRLSVYNIGTLKVYAPPAAQTSGIPGSWTYQGCYTDNVNQQRALFWQIILTNNNTASNCLGLCAQYGYMAGGMEYGDECYCGDDTALIASGSTKQPDSQCTTVCSGDSTYICGDGNRLSYYKWTGTPLYNWNAPTGIAAGKYEFFIGGVVVPLMTSLTIKNKVTFLEKHGTGAPNTTGAYELDLSLSNNFYLAWREMHVQTDIFCSGGLTLPDKAGRQITVGGWAGQSTYGVRLYWPDGSPGVNGTHDWQENVNELTLQTGRWYPSTMILSNGSILVMGGEVGSNSAANPTMEILPKPPGGYVKYLDWLARTNPNNLYPFIFVLPSGGIFVGYYNEARILDPVTFDTLKTLPNIPGSVSNFLAGRSYPLEATAVMLPQHAPYTDPATMLICGGSANGDSLALDNCVSIQPDAANPQWVIERMPSQRVMTCITALPDGTYLILNGAHQGVAGFGLASGPNLGAVLYNPTAPVGSRMSIMANTIVARLYHSEAILLPDGSVLVSGSDPEDGVHPEEYRVEKFLPPYMLTGLAKPTFTITNTDWTYGQGYQIKVNLPSGQASTMSVSLMGAVSSTHGNSMGQKTLFPAFSCAGTTCTITAPPNNKIAPPGWFQLFVLDGPTPSVSQWVRIGGDPAKLGNWPNFPDFIIPGV